MATVARASLQRLLYRDRVAGKVLQDREREVVGFDARSFDKQADLRLQLGLNLNLAANVQLILTGETSGLIIDETDTYAGEANLAIQF